MGDPRFDQRSKSTFQKDIKFATQLEKFFFESWVALCQSGDIPGVDVEAWENNGVCNDGKYVETGKPTAGADYMVNMSYQCGSYLMKKENHPLEMKWAPTAGKLTLKLGDLNRYIAEGASILFIYNNNPDNKDLKKPKDRDFKKHVKRIERAAGDIRWGIMFDGAIERFLHENKDRIENIPYMGFKPGIILPADEYCKYFREERWNV